MFFRCIAVFIFAATMTQAQTNLPTLAQHGLEARLAALQSEPTSSQYEIAFLSALRAIEKAAQMQVQERVGLNLQSNPIFGFGRRDQPRNDLPPPKPQALRDITTTLLADLALARDAINKIENPETARFELNVNDIWFDLDQDRFRGETENVITAMTPILGRRAVEQAAEQQAESGTDIIIRFDHADIAWLTAYTHMLSAIGEATLAFDPTPIIEDLHTSRAALAEVEEIAPFYEASELQNEIAGLETNLKALEDERTAVLKEIDELKRAQKAYDRLINRNSLAKKSFEIIAERDRLQLKIWPLKQENNQLRRRASDLRRLIETAKSNQAEPDSGLQDNGLSQFVDGVYVLVESLRQLPDPTHLNAALKHWDGMIAANQRFWELVAIEIDNDQEWVPNPQQASAIGIEITRQAADTWQQILREADAVVKGDLLIPHPFLPNGTGISLKK